MVNFLYEGVFIFLSLISHGFSAVPAPEQYWQVSPLNYSDTLNAGWEQISVEKEVLIYNGSEIGRTVSASCNYGCNKYD